MSSLRIIALSSAKNLGESINKYLQEKRNTDENFLVPIKEVRFNNGEGKITIEETIREKDVYILSDIGNHSCTYEMYGKTNYMGPDEHFQDIKRVISAMKGHYKSASVVMPLLYASRQHKRKGRESLDCSISLQELQNLGVREIITFDAHDPNVENAVPLLAFENFYPTYSILEKLVHDKKITKDNIDKWIVISPDTGAMDRAKYCANVLGTDVGMFYKRRDYSKIVNGKNPIIAHEYLGKDINGLNAIIVDDMIASGDSILEVAKELKNRGAKEVLLVSTFALFTAGIERFDNAHKEKLFDKLYATNLTYTHESLSKMEWFNLIDCSAFMSEIIDTLNREQSISYLINRKETLI